MPEDATITYVIPLDAVPSRRQGRTNRGGSGVAANGVRLDGPAPVDAILGAYTIAPFDDCGGRVNPHVGYHYHAVTDCFPVHRPRWHRPIATLWRRMAARSASRWTATRSLRICSPMVGAPEGLDACHGHEAEGLPYHYHAGSAGSNQILGCLAAETGCALLKGETVCNASRRPPRP